jgi:hypothetical protein
MSEFQTLVCVDPPREWGAFTLVATYPNTKVWARPGNTDLRVLLATERLGEWKRTSITERAFTKRFGHPITSPYWKGFPKSGQVYKRSTKTVMKGRGITNIKETLE